MKSIEIIAIQPILPTKNNRQQMFWRTYRNRGDTENRIKELKANFGAESFKKAFFPTEAALIFSMIAYNLMSIFRLFVLQEKAENIIYTTI